ncbi:MAG: ADP-ribosylglycohydrolase family protein [Clostridia bacterium]|nr:ADP-ribosylglycohydrolase family protein [Clostridia bacterium]
MLGAIIGDIVGSRFEFNNIRSKKFDLIGRRSSMTDDSIMTCAVDEALLEGAEESGIIDSLKKWGKMYPDAGYGRRFLFWVLSDNTAPIYSFGNGAAMRVSGAGWFANSADEAAKLAKKVTAVTHNHPYGLKGGEVVALCIYYARLGKSKEFIKEYVSKHYNLDFNYALLRDSYGFDETCEGSVPQAIYCFLISKNFEDCLRTTISIGGDCDTTAAISCAIAEAYYKEIDKKIISEVTPLIDAQVFSVLDRCYLKMSKEGKYTASYYPFNRK